MTTEILQGLATQENSNICHYVSKKFHSICFSNNIRLQPRLSENNQRSPSRENTYNHLLENNEN